MCHLAKTGQEAEKQDWDRETANVLPVLCVGTEDDTILFIFFIYLL